MKVGYDIKIDLFTAYSVPRSLIGALLAKGTLTRIYRAQQIPHFLPCHIPVFLNTHTRAETWVGTPRPPTMRYRQTISKSPWLALAWIGRNSNHTVWSLTSFISASKDRVGHREFKELSVRLACLALRNRVECVYDTLIGRDPLIAAILLGIGSSARSRWKTPIVTLWRENVRAIAAQGDSRLSFVGRLPFVTSAL